MKKTLLIVALIGCMLPMMAQKKSVKTPIQLMKETEQKVELLNRMAMSYSEKLDSVLYSYGMKTTLEYDQNLNCVRFNEYEVNEEDVWELSYTADYEYDAQNRVISSFVSYPQYDYYYKETLEYDENGRLSVDHWFIQMDDETWLEYHKITYDYDAQGNKSIVRTYTISDFDGWYESQREEYTYENGVPTQCLIYMWTYEVDDLALDTKTTWEYNAQLQCTKNDTYLWDTGINGWVIRYRTNYSYNNDGDMTQELLSYNEGDGLDYSWKTDYEYDNHHNVSTVTEYDYVDGAWEFDGVSNIEYDLTVPCSKIAGFLTLFEEDVTGLFKDKVLEIRERDADGEIESMTFHYSAANNLNENSDLQCVVCPNPAAETLSVKGANLNQVEVFSIDGKLMMTLDGGFDCVNVSGLAKGNYLLKATLKDGQVITQKFVKQ